jgi:starch phosphorylase
MEASGTGNMKFALNGAVTIGTLDGANVEIQAAVGAENMFVFGLDLAGVRTLRAAGYDPRQYYDGDGELRRALDQIDSGFFTPGHPGACSGLVAGLLGGGDPFMVLADYRPYVDCQQAAGQAYADQPGWTRMSILNCARSGRFSSDRAVREYADEIWQVRPVPVRLATD